ncbi:MAG: hypothetical protein HDR85_02780 [Bacteroides sp.]|nr:hypothetical protein [Bacteroides sp.]
MDYIWLQPMKMGIWEVDHTFEAHHLFTFDKSAMTHGAYIWKYQVKECFTP